MSPTILLDLAPAYQALRKKSWGDYKLVVHQVHTEERYELTWRSQRDWGPSLKAQEEGVAFHDLFQDQIHQFLAPGSSEFAATRVNVQGNYEWTSRSHLLFTFFQFGGQDAEAEIRRWRTIDEFRKAEGCALPTQRWCTLFPDHILLSTSLLPIHGHELSVR